MSIKFSFMHYMKWTRVILPTALEEFELFFTFLAIFYFLDHYQSVKGQL